MHQLHTLQSIGNHHNHHIHLNAAARVEITWWLLLADIWNGISILWDITTLQPQFTLVSEIPQVLGDAEFTGETNGSIFSGQ